MVVRHHSPEVSSRTPAPMARARGGGRLRQSGSLTTECVVALGMVAFAVIPLMFAFMQEANYSRACYHRAAAMEIVDGEMEVLAAGEWKSFQVGEHDYSVTASSATNLPPGRFRLSVEPKKLRLEWRPSSGRTNNAVVRERTLP